MYPLVVADIGGTNARFGLARKNLADGSVDIEQVRVYVTADYPRLEDCLAVYLKTLDGLVVNHVCAAIAGPVLGDEIAMTNCPWRFSQNAVRRELGLDCFAVINDFTAQACSLPLLRATDVVEIKSGRVDETAAKAVIGPGTGLGVAGLLPVKDHWYAISGEGGHRNLPVENDLEFQVLQVVWRELDHVSLESLLCGNGLLRLYRALGEVTGADVRAETPADVTQYALEGDALAVAALNMFCGMLGGAAADLVLTLGARGGVYLAGGILPRVQAFLLASPFNERFVAKGIMSKFVVDVPVYLMVHPQPALLGAAGWMESNYD